MKGTKIYKKTEILFILLLTLAVIMLASSCDSLQDDPDTGQRVPELTQKEVHVWSGSTSVIDLTSLIRSDQAARVSITSMPGKGTLTELGKGLLQYKPDGLFAGYDRVGFTVYGSGNQVLKKDSVVIILETDSTALPCGIYTGDDHVQHATTQPVTIHVLANDILCGVDSAAVQLSIYKPDASFPPAFGTAQVANNTIVYTPAGTKAVDDKIIYRIAAPNGIVSYGFVYIQGVSECTIRPQNDYYELKEDSLVTGTGRLMIFDNDELCQQNWSITKRSVYRQPSLGEAVLSDTLLTYKPAAPWAIGQTDTIGYQICAGEVCYRAKVAIHLKKN